MTAWNPRGREKIRGQADEEREPRLPSAASPEQPGSPQLFTCPRCGAPIGQPSAYCSNCGLPLQPAPSATPGASPRKALAAFAVVVIVLIVIGLLVTNPNTEPIQTSGRADLVITGTTNDRLQVAVFASSCEYGRVPADPSSDT